MLDALKVLDQLERVKGAEKKAVLTKNSDNQELRELLFQALAFERKFHVKQFEIKGGSGDLLPNAHQMFMDLLDVLNDRAVTGGAAIEAIEGFLSKCHPQQQKWYARVIKKDLRCGVSVKTVNACGYDIPVFDVMLATDGNRCKKLKAIVQRGVLVSPKLDGYRCIAISNGGKVTLHSRNGTPYDNFPEIVEELEKVKGDWVLDGEIMSDDFQSMQKSAFASVRGTSVGDVKFHVFGWIHPGEWESGDFKMDSEMRKNLMEGWFAANKPDPNKIVQVNHQMKYWLDEIYELEESYMQQGFEGAMVLPKEAPYYKGRKANHLMKFKRVETMDAEVIDIYEGTGKYVGMMGGLTVTQDNGKTCDVGSGFSDEERQWIWDNKELVMGRLAEVSYQEMTSDDIMRFPIFKRWRDTGPNSDKI